MQKPPKPHPLFPSIKSENLQTLKNLLLHSKSLTNLPDENGTTPLMLSCRFNKSSKIPSFLISQNALINKKDKYGNTALILASRDNKNKKIVKLLIKSGASINERDNEGFSALMNAAEYNFNKEIIDLLILANANPFFKTQFGLDACKLAKVHNRNRMVFYCLRDYRKNFRFRVCRENLVFFFFERNFASFRNVFLEMGFTDRFFDFKNGITFLHAYYLFFGDDDDVRFLLDIVDLKRKCFFGWGYGGYRGWKRKEHFNEYLKIFMN